MKIGFFGCGNMGAALAEGFAKKANRPELYFFTPSQTKARELADKCEGHFVENIADMPKDLDWYVLAFKPQSLSEFYFEFRAEAKVLSVLAGTGIKALQSKLKVEKIARLMPNTPSRVGAGANLYYADFDGQEMVGLISELGKTFVVSSEDKLDALTAFSGSGPALIFEFARLFQKHMGFIAGADENNDFVSLINQTFLGSALLMEEAAKNGVSFEELREQVTSKKGVTFEALQILEKNGLDNIVGGAFSAAYKRTIELKKGI